MKGVGTLGKFGGKAVNKSCKAAKKAGLPGLLALADLCGGGMKKESIRHLMIQQSKYSNSIKLKKVLKMREE